VRYRQDDAFVFGRETAGLPEEILGQFAPEQRLRLPMLPDQRSLNLSNAAAVMAFEVWRQLDFAGGR
jgi:tRNA (cytidine/uridine-2'-O-)-methyltransferase